MEKEEEIIDGLALSSENGIAISEQVETGQKEGPWFGDLCGKAIDQNGSNTGLLIDAYNKDKDRCVDVLKNVPNLTPEEQGKIIDVLIGGTDKIPVIIYEDNKDKRKHNLLIVLIAAAVIAGASGAIVKLIDYFGKKDQNADNKDAKLIEEA